MTTLLTPLAAGTGSSVVVSACQICENRDLKSVLFLGYMPPVNQMRTIGQVPSEQPSYPTNLLYCPNCELVQLGLAVDPNVLFPPGYPYTSGTTRILRDNFAELHRESCALLSLGADDFVIDIGSNDGTLLTNFKEHGHRVLGIEPTDVGKLAQQRGIPTVQHYFRPEVALRVRAEHGAARVITATNCFAHIEDIHSVTDGIIQLLGPKGVFISESHYLIGLLDRLQYDTIYHEHLRYYSLRSLRYLLEMHGLEVIHARHIPTHGGSIRVYASRKGDYPVRDTVKEIIDGEQQGEEMMERLRRFRRQVTLSKLRLLAMLAEVKASGARVCGISAPSRASTLITYLGLDDGIVDYVVEIKGSLKLGKYMPGTLIPVIDESRLFEDQPEYALILSWHIADELAPKLRERGYKGKFIVPLTEPRII
ncbi:MAG TPA: class I SAM-dependent methyltransferase [Candidatus Angelobacter sp.]|nr:class I SAM-dependent methyltransferase [Candidatus Angelobacter sp.]